MENLVVYSLPNCGKCTVLKKTLHGLNIPFEEVQDIEVLKELKIMSVPVLKAGDKLMRYDEAMLFVLSNEKKGE